MEELLAAFGHFSDWRVLLALLVGSIGGVCIGAIPGVGPPVAIAIILPATFSMEPLVGLTMMLGIYGASMYGGALPAVLFNTPGTPVNALTTYDGYPMTKSGQPMRAVTLAYSASFFGGIIGILALIILAPVLASVASHFGAREIFLTALLALVLVILTHRDAMIPAAMLTAFGMFLATIGLDRATYSQRFTFEQSWLSSGIDLIVVVSGLFALSQAFILLSGRDRAPKFEKLSGSVLGGMKEIFRYKRVATTGSFCGVAMGIIPGVGEFLAQFLSYNYAKKTSKEPERFGKGAPEGLIACEAANNPVPAAALVPLLSLGIPGEALTAMMLSVFYVHNVIPGPTLFEQHLDFVLALYIALLLMNIMVLMFLAFSTNQLLQVMRIPKRFLGLLILILSFIGVYTLRNSVTDCFVAAGFGVLGVILSRLKLPFVPIVLGMILGGIMETRLRVAMARVDTPLDFINRPIAAILFCIIVGTILFALLHSRIRSRAERTPSINIPMSE